MLAVNGATKTSVDAWDREGMGKGVRVAYNEATKKSLENV